MLLTLTQQNPRWKTYRVIHPVHPNVFSGRSRVVQLSVAKGEVSVLLEVLRHAHPVLAFSGVTPSVWCDVISLLEVLRHAHPVLTFSVWTKFTV
jgi:hypothetical protein